MAGNGNNPNGYGYGQNPYSDTNGSPARSYSPADAMSYMAARAGANRAAFPAAFPPPYGHGVNRGPTYGDTYGPNSATAMGFGYGSRSATKTTANTYDAGSSTWTDGPRYPSGPPSADALRGAADMAATAARRARNPNGYIPGGGGNGSGPSSGFGGGWRGPNGPVPMGMAGSGWPGTKPGTSYGPARDVKRDNMADGHGNDNEHGNSNAWGHGGYNGNAWGHGGSGNGQDPGY
ncbi:uncharacterized protein GLRG_09645 [Colletotrichum graminicola M1.001]|uniref:Uncharacterized protein n=1 Tax=Colletotrichum graminicola (strain M1.001 / M2 / FGSC 10212) TaxID=645133 RepID=E3QUG3_COLGM|nr:uncharacterized protein GLRG_09645 [Colletotrichum graminicola M1.001]EFQ34501.1 hypothetical protein GLRG_09645 [Colletotrichum graminicola M1.001]